MCRNQGPFLPILSVPVHTVVQRAGQPPLSGAEFSHPPRIAETAPCRGPWTVESVAMNVVLLDGLLGIAPATALSLSYQSDEFREASGVQEMA